MATMAEECTIEASAAAIGNVRLIGLTAGAVWHTLDDQGPLSMAKLVKAVGAPRDLVMQAIGWLAREDKLSIDDSRNKVVSLK
jgi:hypothetical protein